MDSVIKTGELPRVQSRRRSTGELLGLLADISSPAGLAQLAVHRETLLPGRRSSPPHYHTAREELVYVLAGQPSVWIDGEIRRLEPGDSVGFPIGRSVHHMIVNQTGEPAELLVVSVEVGADQVVFGPE